MTEISQVHRNVRDHLGPYGLWLRVENSCPPNGTPDWHYVSRGCSGWLEDKLIPAGGKCPDHFTLDQLMWGEAYVAAGGRWHLLGLTLDRTPAWRLYDAAGARAWFDGNPGRWLLNITGRFPTREILDRVAPLDKPTHIAGRELTPFRF